MLEVLETLDGAAVVRWGHACVEGLVRHCDEINDLNVFPIPDSDTGTNLLFTMRAAVDSIARLVPENPTAHDVAAAMARGATTGARGNSGIILSQVMRGVAEATVDGPLTGRTLADALHAAATLVRGAVSVPVEGTVVTVLDCAAAAARTCARDSPVAEVATIAADAAVDALQRTRGQLDVLEAAGAVDAGGLGLVVLLDAMVAVITGVEPQRPRFVRERRNSAAPARDAAADSQLAQDYEVMFLLRETDENQVAILRRHLGQLGDSVIIVSDGDGCWSAHVHCRDAGAAVDAGLAAGRVHQVRINCFALDAANAGAVVESPTVDFADRGILAVVAGDGAAALYEGEGATVLRCDEPISATQLLKAIRAMDNREVLVLPNGALSAQELVAVGVAARDARRDVLLLPCSSMVQGLAALAVHDQMRIAVDDAFAMSEAASSTRWGSLRVAPGRALTLVGTCNEGDGLGLIGHEVVVIEADVAVAGRLLLDRVLGLGGELVTFLVGADAPAELVEQLSEHVSQHHQGVELMIYPGGQAGDLLQLGVE
ncbi:DAK2 domain-containing protein [Antrihabitans sp. YC3-6]|uniref:DAK2 domain-containing protein n=1 Tax=Antrihabitans stalagmiti TaxID=2799499 RepID=A0A934NVB9_9NOCA|nr:DAK2 domain-containing protein [Antrihabitans stalagmiti]MBJ8342249.1 DAK2 domain-containing protein [Antrihabitans stalagmiti]